MTKSLDVKNLFSEEQIIGFVREAEAGMPIKNLCRRGKACPGCWTDWPCSAAWHE